jgi:DNA segregation ATPase FtsK/SpoIIIE-like protein
VKLRASQILRGYRALAAASIVAWALLVVPTGASAASPVLEVVVPGNTFPVSFTTKGGPVEAEMAGTNMHCSASSGEGDITGPRSTVSDYTFTGCAAASKKCQSKNAQEGEIKTGLIDAELVYINQAKREVGVLVNPRGETYITFECGEESVKGQGPFLASIAPINEEATFGTATLSKSGGVQTPNEYESANGEKLQAIPLGKSGSGKLVATGVETTITVHTSVPVEIKAITAEEVETKQHKTFKELFEEHTKQVAEEAAAKEAQKRHEEEAANKKHEEEVNAQTATNEMNAQAAASKKHQEEEATKKAEEERKAKSKPLTRAQLLAKALKQCSKQPKKRRAQCKAKAEQKYGGKGAGKKGKKFSHRRHGHG